jgi:hypothetical protein
MLHLWSNAISDTASRKVDPESGGVTFESF